MKLDGYVDEQGRIRGTDWLPWLQRIIDETVERPGNGQAPKAKIARMKKSRIS